MYQEVVYPALNEGNINGTSNTRVTGKQENPLKVIRNIDNNGTSIQWPHGLAVPTYIEH